MRKTFSYKKNQLYNFHIICIGYAYFLEDLNRWKIDVLPKKINDLLPIYNCDDDIQPISIFHDYNDNYFIDVIDYEIREPQIERHSQIFPHYNFSDCFYFNKMKTNLPKIISFPDSENFVINNPYYLYESFFDSTHFRCQCGCELLLSETSKLCCNNKFFKLDKIRPPGPPADLAKAISLECKSNANFARILNSDISPVLKNAYIGKSIPGLKFVMMKGTPYAYVPNESQSHTIQLIFSDAIYNKTNRNLHDIVVKRAYDESPVINKFLKLNENNNVGDFNIEFSDNSKFAPGMTMIRHNDEEFGAEPPISFVYKPDSDCPKFINSNSLEYDHLCFPLLFWSGIGGVGRDYSVGKLSFSQKWKLILLDHKGSFIHNCGLLREQYTLETYGRERDVSLQYMLDCVKKIYYESNIKNHKNDFGGESNEGERIFISSNIVGSKRYWNKILLNLLSVVRRYGNPQFFVTMTCNPYWSEIQVSLKPGEKYSNNSLLVARVFKIKLKKCIDWIKNSTEKPFGKISHYFYRIEYQNRGLPHVHLLLWSDLDIMNPNIIDEIVSAEMPHEESFEDKESFNLWSELVSKYQIHHHSDRCKTNSGNGCIYKYPIQELHNKTIVEPKRILYRRRKRIDSMIVPYSPKLLFRLRAHSNVEIITTGSFPGYVTKYVSKADDYKNVNSKIMYKGKEVNKNNEYDYWRATRVINAVEACNGLLINHSYVLKPAVIVLPIHLPSNRIIISIDSDIEEIKKKLDNSLSKLERYFARPVDDIFNSLTYSEYYENYNISSNKPNSRNVWIDQGKNSKLKLYVYKNEKNRIARISSYFPNSGEIFYLRILLLNFQCRCFEDLLIMKDSHGTITYFNSFHESAIAHGLVQNDNEGVLCLEESISLNRTPRTLRFFAFLLLCEGLISFDCLKEKFLIELTQDIADREKLDFNNENDLTNLKYYFDFEFISLCKKNSINPSKYNIPVSLPDSFKQFLLTELKEYCNALDEFYQCNRIDLRKLNSEQKNVHDKIINFLLCKDNKGKLIYLQGRAGTGKTFTVKAILQTLYDNNIITLRCGSTGMAAIQYFRGLTLHKCFKLTIKGTQAYLNSPTSILIGSTYAEFINMAEVIILDEVSMITEQILSQLDFSLKKITQSNERFANKNILLIGDFLQLPPVTADSYTNTYAKMILSSKQYNFDVTFALKNTMRFQDKNNVFTNFIYKIANNEIGNLHWREINFLKWTTSTDEAVEFLTEGVSKYGKFPTNRLMISGHNKSVDEFNTLIQNSRKVENTEYFNCKANYSSDYFNNLEDPQEIAIYRDLMESIHDPSLADDEIYIQVNDPVWILRNISVNDGLVKGTRANVVSVSKYGNTIHLELENSEVTVLPRISFPYEINKVKFIRKQIPIKIGYCVTIHRCQGLTLDRVVLDLRTPLWEHGQLYVALSRVKHPDNLLLLLPEMDSDKSDLISPVCDEHVVKDVLAMESSL